MIKFSLHTVAKKVMFALLSGTLLATLSLAANALSLSPSTAQISLVGVASNVDHLTILAAAPRRRPGRVVNRSTRIIRGPLGRPVARETCVTRRGPLGRENTECTRTRIRR